jgi:hypothetical protein
MLLILSITPRSLIIFFLLDTLFVEVAAFRYKHNDLHLRTRAFLGLVRHSDLIRSLISKYYGFTFQQKTHGKEFYIFMKNTSDFNKKSRSVTKLTCI